MSRYLVTGGWGKLGSELKGKLDASMPTKAEMNILDLAAIEHWLNKSAAGTILHLAAISDVRLADTNKRLSYETNVHGTAQVAEAARRFNKKIIYISTDYVFPGTRGNYSEDAEPSPANWYGFTKYAGELEIQTRTDNYLIIRTSFRPHNWPFKTAYDNVFTSADYTDIIAQEILQALKLDLRGIIHIGTPKKTLFQLAKQRNPDILPETAPADFPHNKDLCIDRWKKLKQTA